MEPNENQLGSYYYHQPQQLQPHHQLHHRQQQTTAANANITPSTTASPTKGLLPNAEASHTVYPHSVASAVSSHLETVKRKRGRPRKYGTQEQALAAKKAAAAAASSSSHSYSKDKEDRALAGGSTADASLIRTNEKVHSFSATSGGSVTYEGHYDIISLSGSYIHTELGGRTGGLSVCLSSTDGQIIGGGVGGPLKAAGPVQVIVGTFFMETKMDGGVKGGSTGNKLPLQITDESISNVGLHSVVDSSGAMGRGNGDHQAIGASHFMIQSWSVQVTPGPTDWRDHAGVRNTGGYELSGRRSHGAQEYPENGDYDQIPD